MRITGMAGKLDAAFGCCVASATAILWSSSCVTCPEEDIHLEGTEPIYATEIETNGLSVITRDIYLREGYTNLVRCLVYEEGKQILCSHHFYYQGENTGHSMAMKDSWYFLVEADSQYSMSIGSGPASDVTYVLIMDKDGVFCDNYIYHDGKFYPVLHSKCSELNAVFSK